MTRNPVSSQVPAIARASGAAAPASPARYAPISSTGMRPWAEGSVLAAARLMSEEDTACQWPWTVRSVSCSACLNSGGDHMSTHLPGDWPVPELGQQSLGRHIRRFAETIGIALFDFVA